MRPMENKSIVDNALYSMDSPDVRLSAFEDMLDEIITQMDAENARMAELRDAGKVKSAEYHQLFGNRMLYKAMLERYRAHGLIE